MYDSPSPSLELDEGLVCLSILMVISSVVAPGIWGDYTTRSGCIL